MDVAIWSRGIHNVQISVIGIHDILQHGSDGLATKIVVFVVVVLFVALIVR